MRSPGQRGLLIRRTLDDSSLKRELQRGVSKIKSPIWLQNDAGLGKMLPHLYEKS